MVLTDKEQRDMLDIATEIINECEERSKESTKISYKGCVSDYITGAKIFARGLSDPKLVEMVDEVDITIRRHGPRKK